MKRLFDIVFSGFILLLFSPVMLAAMLLVWLHDRSSPIYLAPRVGIGNRDFLMTKIRSMQTDADRTGGTSTSANDSRITPVGHYIRKLKLDELSQFWDVIKGTMSVVGPRPITRNNGVDLFTRAEMKLLTVKPGITDLSSIVFADEGAILANADDVDALYNRVIRPWKSRLGLIYVEHSSLTLDLNIIWLTALSVVSRPRALAGVNRILSDLGAEDRLIETCRRQAPLQPHSPPGAGTHTGTALQN